MSRRRRRSPLTHNQFLGGLVGPRPARNIEPIDRRENHEGHGCPDDPTWNPGRKDFDVPPHGAVFLGYGGSSSEYETRVYEWRGQEVRFPCNPRDGWGPNEVAAEYGCLSGDDWADVIEQAENRGR